MKFEAVIGLEVHVQLNTKTKIFCGCSTDYNGMAPNSRACEICSGQPGVLPVLNSEVLERAIKAGLSLNCEISRKTKFDRKNYFYPDLPKGYQISQFDLPICRNGFLNIVVPAEKENEYYEKKVGITRIHMEEDAGKNVHGEHGDKRSYVDLNRAGVPLLEIVSEPDIRTSTEAREYLEKLKTILKFIKISDCNMEDGSLRCDANVSIRPVGETKLGTKTEIKNMNSFKSVQKAIDYEIERQIESVLKGNKIIQETRLYDEAKNITLTMRKKEEAFDYRYFPEPDLPPYVIESQTIDRIKAGLPELPDVKFKRYTQDYQLPSYDSKIISNDYSLAFFFENCCSAYKNYKTISNWILGDMLKLMNETQTDDILKTNFKPEFLVEMLELIDNGTISGKIGKTIINEMFKTPESPKQIISRLGLVQISDDNLILNLVTEVLTENKKSVDDFIGGKDAAKGFLVGQLMKKTKGKANPKLVNEILDRELNNLKNK